jgi:PPOX class probable F420-dependent enzyme
VKLTDKQRALLDGPNYAVVAVLDDRGRPRSTVVWVDREGDTVRINTTTVRAKGRHLAHGGYVSVLVFDGADFHRWFEVEGPAELSGEGADAHIHALSRKYTGHDFSDPQNRVIVRVAPERVNEYDL